MWWWAMTSLAGDLEPPAALWAGHQVTITTRSVPLLGKIETRQEVWTLSQVADTGDTVTLVETPCEISLHSDGGVQLSFAAGASQRIPPPTIRFATGPDGVLTDRWEGGWGEADVDGDGKPGFAVRVQAPLCGGSLSVATRTVSTGTATRADGGLDGTITIALERDILSTSNPCLGLLSKHTTEVTTGAFAHRPVPEGSTCAGLLAGPWPVQVAPRPVSAQ